MNWMSSLTLFGQYRGIFGQPLNSFTCI